MRNKWWYVVIGRRDGKEVLVVSDDLGTAQAAQAISQSGYLGLPIAPLTAFFCETAAAARYRFLAWDADAGGAGRAAIAEKMESILEGCGGERIIITHAR